MINNLLHHQHQDHHCLEILHWIQTHTHTQNKKNNINFKDCFLMLPKGRGRKGKQDLEAKQ